jgi:hypothetical protein
MWNPECGMFKWGVWCADCLNGEYGIRSVDCGLFKLRTGSVQVVVQSAGCLNGEWAMGNLQVVVWSADYN